MSNFFEEDPENDNDFSWSCNVASSDYGFLLISLESVCVKNFINANHVWNENYSKAYDSIGGGFFSTFRGPKSEPKENGFMSFVKGCVDDVSTCRNISQCRKDLFPQIDEVNNSVRQEYRVESKTVLDALKTFYARNATNGESRETHLKPLVVNSSALKEESCGDVDCTIIESGTAIGEVGVPIRLDCRFLKKFYSPLEPSTHASTYAKLLHVSKAEVENMLRSGNDIPKIIFDSEIQSLERSFQTGFWGKRKIPENEMIVVDIDGHQGGLIISNRFANLFTM